MKGSRRVTVTLQATVRNGAVLQRLLRALAMTASVVGRNVTVTTDQADNGRLLDRALPGWYWVDEHGVEL